MDVDDDDELKELKAKLATLENNPHEVDVFIKEHKLENVNGMEDLLKSGNADIDSINHLIDEQNIANQAKGIIGVNKALEHFNELQEDQDARSKFIEALQSQNVELSNFLGGIEGGNASLSGYVAHLVSSTVKTIGLQAATMALNAAISMGIALLVQAAVSAVTSIASISSDIIKQTSEATEAFRQQSQSIDDNKAKIQELREALDDESISYEDAYEKRKELLGIQTGLIDSYGSEADGIDLVNGKLDEQIAKLDEIKRKKAQETINDINKNTSGQKWFNVLSKSPYSFFKEIGKQAFTTDDGLKNGGLSKALDSSTDYMVNGGITYQDIFGTNEEAITKKVENFSKSFKKTGDILTDQFIKSFDNIKLDGDNFVIEGNVQEVSDTISEIQNKLKGVTSENETFNKQLTNIYNSAKQIADENMDSYNAIVEAQILQDTSDGGAAEYYKKLTEAYSSYTDAMASGNEDEIDKAKETYTSILSDIDTSAISNAQKDYLKTMFSDMQSVINDYNFEIKIKPGLDNSDSNLNKNLSNLSSLTGQEIIDFSNSGGVGATDIQWQSIQYLNECAQAANMTLEELVGKLTSMGKIDDGSAKVMKTITDRFSKGSTQKAQLISEFLKKNGVDTLEELDNFNRLTAGINDFEQAYNRYTSTVASSEYLDMSDSIASLSEMKTSLESTTNAVSVLSSAMKEQSSQGYITQESYDKLIEVDSNYAKCLQFSAGYMQINTEKAHELTKATAEQRIAQLELKEALEVQQYNENAKKINELQSRYAELKDDEMSELQSLRSSNDQIKSNIQSYDILESQLRGVTSAYNDWINGMSEGDHGDQYDSVVSKMKDMQALLDEHAYGSKDLNNFSNLLFGEDFDQSTFEQRYKEVSKYLTEGSQGVQNFTDKLIELGYAEKNANGDIAFEKIDTSKLADELGISVELVDLLFDKIQLYSNDITWESTTEGLKNLQLATNDVQEAMTAYQTSIDTLNSQGVDTTEVQTQLNELKEQWNSLTSDERSTQLKELEAKLTAEDDATPEVEKFTSSMQKAQEEITKFNGMSLSDPGFDLLTQQANGANDSISKISGSVDTLNTKLDGMNGKKISFSVESKTTKSGDSEANGTFHIGSAFAHGSGIGAKESGLSLTGELGEELVVRGDRYFTVGSHGAEFANIKKGDIVFNAEQTRQLLYGNGKINSRGVALARGTVGNAYADRDEKISGSVNWNNSSSNSNSNNKKKKKDAKKTKTIIDWIEKRISHFSTLVDRWVKQAEKAGSEMIDKLYSRVEKNEKSLSNTYLSGYNRYIKQANKTKFTAAENKKYGGKDKNLAKRIREGAIDISTIKSEKTANKISDYENWYKKAQAALDNFLESAQKLANLPLDKAATKIEKFESAIESLDKKLDNLKVTDYKGKDTIIDSKLKDSENILKAQQTAKTDADNYVSETTNALSKINNNKKDREKSGIKDDEKKIIANAISKNQEVDLTLFKTGSAGYKAAAKYNEALRAQQTAIKNADDALQDYNKTKREYAKEKFDNVTASFEAQIQIANEDMSRLDRRIQEIETSGANVNKAYYEQQRKDNAGILAQYKNMLKTQTEYLANIPEGTQEWYDARQEIESTKDAISDCTTKTMELNNAINELNFKMYEDIRTEFERVANEYEFIASLKAHEKNYDTDTGATTEYGYMNLGVATIGMESSKKSAEETKKQLDELKKAVKQSDGTYRINDLTFNSWDDWQTKINETYDTWKDAIQSTYDKENKVVDLMKEKYQTLLDVFNDLVSKKKEALQLEKDLRDYQRNIKSQTDDIAKISKQIAAYRGDTSAEGQAKLQSLEKQRLDAEQKLKETEEDKAYEDITNMLDKMSTEYSEMVQKKLDDFDALLKEGVEAANKNTAILTSVFGDVSKENGFEQQYGNITTALGKDGDIATTINNAASSIASAIAGKSGTQTDNKTQSESSGNSSNNNTATNNKPSDPLPTKSDISTALNALNAISPTATTKAIEGFAINAKKGSALDKASKYVFDHFNKTSSDKNLSDVNKAFYKKYNKNVLSGDELKALAKLLGVKYNNASKSGNLYKKLKSIKFPGFSKGGVVNVDDLQKQIKVNGDTSLASVKVGERILTPVQNQNFEKLMASPLFQNPSVLNGLENIAKLPDISKVTNNKQGDVNVSDVNFTFNLDNVTDTQTFLREIKNNKSVQNAIQTVVLNPMMGKSVNGVKHL